MNQPKRIDSHHSTTMITMLGEEVIVTYSPRVSLSVTDKTPWRALKSIANSLREMSQDALALATRLENEAHQALPPHCRFCHGPCRRFDPVTRDHYFGG